MLTIGDVGERALLDRILALLPTGTPEVGPGDDAAVARLGDGRTVVTCDTLIEGPDFRREWSSPWQVGFKSVVVNFADIAAMGAEPQGIVLAFAAPIDTPVEWMEDCCRGIHAAFSRYAPRTGVLGGDLATADQLMISITAFGSLDDGQPVLRSGAQPGDVVAIAGDLGRAAAGLHLCFAGATERLSELTPDQQDLVTAQLAPSPPLHAGRVARSAGATAMMDVSDGLLLDSHRLALASGVQLQFNTSRWQARTSVLAAHLGVSETEARHLELTGGEDHALLATFPAPGIGESLPEPFDIIGSVTAGEEAGVFVDGAPVAAAGWDPYASGANGVGSR